MASTHHLFDKLPTVRLLICACIVLGGIVAGCSIGDSSEVSAKNPCDFDSKRAKWNAYVLDRHDAVVRVAWLGPHTEPACAVDLQATTLTLYTKAPAFGDLDEELRCVYAALPEGYRGSGYLTDGAKGEVHRSGGGLRQFGDTRDEVKRMLTTGVGCRPV